MFKKTKIDDNTKEYKFFGQTIAKKISSPYGYEIYIRNKKFFTKFHLQKFLEFQNQEQATELRQQIAKIQQQATELQNVMGYFLEFFHMPSPGKCSFPIKLDKKIDNLIALHLAHQDTFKTYKNKFLGKDIVVIASGPSMTAYQSIKGVIHIGVNKTYKREDIKFDYFFVQDISGLRDDIEKIDAYRPEECQKFYGANVNENRSIPEYNLMQANAKRYYTGPGYTDFYPDISSSVLPEFGTVAFSALSFALYTHPKRIYLVGCDASDSGYFDDPHAPPFTPCMDMVMFGWQQFKKFRDIYYPDVEIISINPVGLKGMFNDIYM